MKKYYVYGKEVTALEKAEHKLLQLQEAYDLLEEFSDRCAWAEDMAEYDSIRQAIDDVFTAIERSKDEIEEMIDEMESQLEVMEEKKKDSEVQLKKEFEQNIQYCLS